MLNLTRTAANRESSFDSFSLTHSSSTLSQHQHGATLAIASSLQTSASPPSSQKYSGAPLCFEGLQHSKSCRLPFGPPLDFDRNFVRIIFKILSPQLLHAFLLPNHVGICTVMRSLCPSNSTHLPISGRPETVPLSATGSSVHPIHLGIFSSAPKHEATLDAPCG